MVRSRKSPKLRVHKGKYYCTDIYLPDGRRSTINFGSTDDRSEGEIFVAFGKWIDLYKQHPHKVLFFSSPYDAVKEMVNPQVAISIRELLKKYRNYASKTIAKVDSNKRHPDYTFMDRIEKFIKPYMDWPAKEFGPDELLDVQRAMIEHRYVSGKKEKRYTRRGINDNINWIRRVWKWAMGRCMVTAEQVQGFEEVKGLRIGTSKAPDNVRRKRVTEEEIEKVLNCLGSVVADMLRVIWYTGMRPNEVCTMRPYDIIRDDEECWLYIPGRDHSPVGKHKTMRFERAKVIPLTTEVQAIFKKRITDFDSKDYVFSPKDTVAELIARKSQNRKTPLSCGNRPGTNRNEHPMIKPRDCYDHATLRRACQRACKKAGVEIFVPYDLRRTMATRTRATLGKEATKVLLGHTKTSTTEIYLLEEVQEAVKVAKLLSANG
jgi:integrase